MRTIPAFVTIDDDLGMPYSDRERRDGCIYLEMNAYNDIGDHVGSLSEIEFFKDSNDWVSGRFYFVSEIPERCDHLREVARGLGLPERPVDLMNPDQREQLFLEITLWLRFAECFGIN